MSYDLKSLRAELTSKNCADKGLVAIGQTMKGKGLSGSLIAGTRTEKYSISIVGSKLTIIPYTYHKIQYEAGVAYDKMIIEKVKITGDGIFVLKKLKIWTIDGKLHTYFIIQGIRTVKQMLRELELIY